MPVIAQVPDHRYYYLHHFLHAMQWLMQRYDDLLSESQKQFVTQLKHLPLHSQALYVRMLMRRGPWFRESKLRYEEIPSTRAAAQPLVDLGWLNPHTPMSMATLFDLHTHTELKVIFKDHGSTVQSTKRAWLQSMTDAYPDSLSYRQWHPQSNEAVWQQCEAITALCQRLKLMFFGNTRQTWSEYVLADLGVFRYETVAFPPAARAFECQEDIDTYLTMQGCSDALKDGNKPAAPLIEALAHCRTPNPWLERRRSKVLMQLGQACEKIQDHASAQLAYTQSQFPGSRQRLIRVLELQGAHQDALLLAQLALQAPENEAEQQKVKRMLPRLLRQTGNHAKRNCSSTRDIAAEARMDIVLPALSPGERVEWTLRAHWHTPQTPVFYVENTLITALFGLLCWPAVFAPVQGAFFHPFQSAPADFSAPDFAQRRADCFAACLQELADGRYLTTIAARFKEKQGIQNPLVIWPALSEDLLNLALHCIPCNHLQAIFLRLQSDPKNHRTGLPDLIRFWPEERRYEMVEVKAPGDQLQDNQIRWFQWFALHGIVAKVCHVTWHESPVPVPESVPVSFPCE